MTHSSTAFSLLLSGALATSSLHADPIPVRHTEGRLRGFVVLRSEAGKVIGSGEMSQVTSGERVTYRMTYRFKDGSLDDETAVFTQRGTFRFVSDHHIQRGPFFPKPFEMTISADGNVTSRYPDSGGKLHVETAHLDLPPDFVSGFICTVMANLTPGNSYHVALVAPTPKVRLIRLDITPEPAADFTISGVRYKSSVFRLHTQLGGVAGVVAPLIGKQPEDIFVWVAEGVAPAVVRATAQLCEGGPVVSIELAGGTFPRL